MNLLFYKALDSPHIFHKERQIIKIGLLLSEKLYAITPTLAGISVYRNKDRAGDRDIINNYKHYYSNNGAGHTAAELDTFIDALLKLKNKKFKTREEIIMIGRMDKNFKIIEGDVNRATEAWLQQNFIEPFVQFTVEEELLIYDLSIELEKDEDFVERILITELSEPGMFHFLINGEPTSDAEEEEEEETDETKYHTALIYKSALFEIPCLDSFTYSQMKIIRNEFQAHLHPFFDELTKLNTKFENYILNDETKDAIAKEFDAIIDPQILFLKDLIADNIYFQQIANSSKDHKTYRVNLCYSTIDSLLLLYQKAAVTNQEGRENIIENLSPYKDINTCIVFFEMEEITTG